MPLPAARAIEPPGPPEHPGPLSGTSGTLTRRWPVLASLIPHRLLDLPDLPDLPGPGDVVTALLVAGCGFWLDDRFTGQFLLLCCFLPLVRLGPGLLAPVVALAGGIGYWWWLDRLADPFGQSVMWCLPVAVAGWYAGRRRVGAWTLLVLAVAALIGTTPAVIAPVPTLAVAAGYVAGRIWTSQDRIGALTLQLGRARAEVTAVRDENRTLEERSALARELHDVVGHHLSVISLAAEAATLRPESTPESLERIRAASHDAMSELDVILRSLHRDGESAPLEPNKGLGDIDELLEALRQAGLHVDSSILVTAPVPSGLQLTVYRIVQEGMTNILRHAGATRASLTVVAQDSLLSVRVGDDGTGVQDADLGTGRGLTGIAERVRGFGGDWSVGVSPWGGTQLDVVLPLTPDMLPG
ncbi:histidine kinase [Kineosporia sp. NBRC 101731]|uniref:sensor histidine kinase n=1 Tax=Kineosporia sp. NBRC 101731 TaxID=3032199 RepID=UPI0024A047BA|nr:histidine kinase [Kineosporia sp. NBRC 101731]GLY29677.1 two-component sensor histidine kinase [Kineosporia sp. NBRC 101731]